MDNDHSGSPTGDQSPSPVAHTPGPWPVTQEDLRGGRYWCVQIGDDTADFHEDENGEANARLIAAAPELLAAILNSDDAHWTPAMRAAIAKATSGTPDRSDVTQSQAAR